MRHGRSGEDRGELESRPRLPELGALGTPRSLQGVLTASAWKPRGHKCHPSTEAQQSTATVTLEGGSRPASSLTRRHRPGRQNPAHVSRGRKWGVQRHLAAGSAAPGSAAQCPTPPSFQPQGQGVGQRCLRQPELAGPGAGRPGEAGGASWWVGGA